MGQVRKTVEQHSSVSAGQLASRLATAGFVGIKSDKHSGRGVAIAGIVLSIISLVAMLGMCGCAGTAARSSSGSSSSEALSSAPLSASSAPLETSALLSDKTTTVGPLSFNLPKGWVSQKDSKGNENYYPSATERSSLLIVGGKSAQLGEGQSEDECLEGFVGELIRSFGDGYNITSEEDGTVSGCAAKRVRAKGPTKSGGEAMEVQMCCAIASGYLVAMVGGTPNGKYDAEISACIDSLEINQSVITASGDQQSQSSAASGTGQTGNAGAVSPELKEALDGYEAFVDEYLEFMKKYKESDDATSMMADYLDYLQQYSDLVQKINAIDAQSLSTADYAYYIDVTSRVSKKLLEVSL